MGGEGLPWLAFVCVATYAGACVLLLRGADDGLARHVQSAGRAIPAVLRRLAEGDAEARRRARCAEELPELLDVLTLGLTAGLSFDMALELCCERTPGELSEALRGKSVSWQLGLETRPEALRELAEELRSPAMGRFAETVAESLEFGSPLAQALERQADAILDERRAEAEERIEKAPVKLLFPLGMLIVPAMLLSILGPLIAAATQAF